VYRSFKNDTQRQRLAGEIIAVIAKLPQLAKKSISKFKITSSKSIGTSSVLIMRIVQEVARPFNCPDECFEDAVANANKKATSASALFIRLIAYRCAQKVGKSDPDDKFCQVTQEFVEDLIAAAPLPEWPGATMLLEHLHSIVCNNLSDLQANSKLRTAAIKNGTDLALRKSFVHIAGEIAAQQKQSMQAFEKLDRGSYIFPLSEKDPAEATETQRIEEAEDTFTSTLSGSNFTPAHIEKMAAQMFGGDVLVGGSWFDKAKGVSLDAQIRAAVQEQIARAQQCNPNDNKFVVEAENNYAAVLMQLVVNYFQQHESEDSALGHLVGCWANRLSDSPVGAYLCWILQYSTPVSNKSVVVLPENELQQVYTSLIRLNAVFSTQAFDRLFDSIAAMLHDDSPQLRMRAVKALTKIVNTDNSVLLSDRAKRSVAQGVLDRSPLVRDATLELMGQYMQEMPELVSYYYDTIHERIHDVATSVRKRVVNIFKNVLMRWPTCEKSVPMCVDLVRCIHDEEDSIRELVTKTLQQLWFVPLAEIKERGSALSAVAHQIMEVSCIPSGHDWVTEMLRNILKSEMKTTASRAKKSQARPVHHVCEELCKHLVEELNEIDKHDLESNTQRVLKHMTALVMFASVDGALVSPHIPALHVHLADHRLADSTAKQKIVQAVAQIIDAGLPAVTKPEQTLLEHVEKALGVLVISVGRSPLVLQHSVKCLCTVVDKGTHNVALLEELLKRNYHCLAPLAEETDTMTAETRPQAVRTMFILGLLCRYYAFDKPSVEGGLKGEGEADEILQAGQVNKAVLQLLWKFYKSEDVDFQHRAVQSMGHIFCTAPQLMMAAASQKMFAECLTSPEVKLKAQVLRTMSDYLSCETEAIETSNGRKDVGPKAAKTESRNADSGISPALIQRHLELLQECCIHPDRRVRIEAVKVMQFVVKQKLVPPFQCVPSLVALSCDQDPQSRDMAASLLGMIYDKHPDMVSTKAVEGVQLAYRFMGKPNEPPVLKFTDGVAGLQRLYKLFRTNRQRRDAFLESVIKATGKFIEGSSDQSIKFHIFLLQQLATFPYVVRDEPLLVIYKASELLSRHTDATMNLLRRFGKNEDNQTVDPAEAIKCLEQVAIVDMLICVKAHLKTVHALSDAICEGFAPSARDPKEKAKPLTIWSEEAPPVLDVSWLQIFLQRDVSQELLLSAYKAAKEVLQKDFVNDFKIEAKKVRKARASPSEKKSSEKKERGKSAKKAKAKKRKKLTLDSEEDEDDDEDEDFA